MVRIEKEMIMIDVKITEKEFNTGLTNARIAISNMTGYRQVGGCGRVYVEIISPKVRANSKIAKLIESFGYRMTSRPYSTGKNRIYVGYDNATGKEYMMGEIIAKELKAVGVSCYVDGDGD